VEDEREGGRVSIQSKGAEGRIRLAHVPGRRQGHRRPTGGGGVGAGVGVPIGSCPCCCIFFVFFFLCFIVLVRWPLTRRMRFPLCVWGCGGGGISVRTEREGRACSEEGGAHSNHGGEGASGGRSVQQAFLSPIPIDHHFIAKRGCVCASMWSRIFVASGLHLFATPSKHVRFPALPCPSFLPLRSLPPSFLPRPTSQAGGSKCSWRAGRKEARGRKPCLVPSHADREGCGGKSISTSPILFFWGGGCSVVWCGGSGQAQHAQAWPASEGCVACTSCQYASSRQSQGCLLACLGDPSTKAPRRSLLPCL